MVLLIKILLFPFVFIHYLTKGQSPSHRQGPGPDLYEQEMIEDEIMALDKRIEALEQQKQFYYDRANNPQLGREVQLRNLNRATKLEMEILKLSRKVVEKRDKM